MTIFAASFGHNSGQDRRLKGHQLARGEWHQGVRFVWVRTLPYRGNTWRRDLNMLSFLLVFVVAQAREPRPGFVVGSTVDPFAALGGWLAARLRRAAFAFEIRDLWPQTLVDLGALRMGSPGERLLRAIEAFLVRRASTVITLLPGIRDYLEAQGLPTGHVVYLPNGADLDAYGEGAMTSGAPAAVTSAMDEIARMRRDGRLVVGYLGAFGRVNRADLIAEAAVEADRRQPGRIGVVLIGQGPEGRLVEQRAAGHAAVSVCPPVPKPFVPAVLRALDAAVVHTTYTPVYKYGVSFNKLFEYMAAERPVIFACDAAYDPVASTGAGVTTKPDDPGAMATAFLDVAALSPEARAAMGRAGRDFVDREHNFDQLGATLADLVETGSQDRGCAPHRS